MFADRNASVSNISGLHELSGPGDNTPSRLDLYHTSGHFQSESHGPTIVYNLCICVTISNVYQKLILRARKVDGQYWLCSPSSSSSCCTETDWGKRIPYPDLTILHLLVNSFSTSVNCNNCAAKRFLFLLKSATRGEYFFGTSCVS